MLDGKTLSEQQKTAAKNLMDANAALIGIVNDAYAPIYVRNILEVVDQRLREIRHLYSPEQFKPKS